MRSPYWLELAKEFFLGDRVERTKRNIPPLDGPLLLNSRLEECDEVEGASLPAPKDLLLDDDGSLLVSSDDQVVRCYGANHEEREVVAKLPGPTGGLAFDREGRVLVCVSGAGVMRLSGSSAEPLVVEADGKPLRCPTDLAVAADGTVYVTDGSLENRPEDWAHDLMQRNVAGRLVAFDPDAGTARILSDRMPYPSGVTLADGDRALMVATAWDHSLRRYTPDGRLDTMLQTNLPGYPGRINAASNGDFWVAFFALRTHLVEFVLTQDEFREEMMSTIAAEHWIRPAVKRLDSGLEPLQGGGIRKLGRVKPWAPPRSYGMVVGVDGDGQPWVSLQSPADGRRHGVASAKQSGDRLYIACEGADSVLIAQEEMWET